MSKIASLLGIAQPDVSHLMNGHFRRCPTDQVLDFLKRLDRKVTFRISPHKPGEPYQEVGVTTGFTIQMQGAHQFKKVHLFVTDH